MILQGLPTWRGCSVCKQRSVFFVFFLIITSILFLYSQSHARDSGTRTSAPKKLKTSIAAGWGLHKMPEINIDQGFSLSADATYLMARSISAGLGIVYLRGYSSQIATTLVAREFKLVYHIPRNGGDWFFRAGLAWCTGSAVHREYGKRRDYDSPSPTRDRFAGQGTGFSIAAGASENLNPTFSFEYQLGYMHFLTGELKNEYGEVWSPSQFYAPDRANLDFSGPFILAGFSVGL